MIKTKNISTIYFYIFFLIINIMGLTTASCNDIDNNKRETKSNQAVNDTDNNKEIESSQTTKEIPIYGYIENIYIDNGRLKLKAKLDSGAKTSSLNALEVVEFERDGKEWIKFYMKNPENKEKVAFEKQIIRHTKIKQQGTENQKRPVVMMEIQLGNTRVEREFSLVSRDKFIYQVLLGRNFINGIALIDVSRTFLASSTIVAEKD